MKKQIIALLIMLLIGLACWADGVMINSFRYVTSGTGLCSSCTPGDPSDVFCEDLEGSSDCGNDSGAASTCHCSWTSTEDGSGSLSFASTRNQSTNPCENKGTYNIDLNCTGSYDNWDNEYSIAKSFSAKTAIYAQAYIYIESESLNDNERVFLFSLADAGNEHDAMAVALRQVSGALYIATYANDGGTGPGIGSTALSTGTWYRLGIEYTSNTANGGRIYINGVEDTNCRINTPEVSIGYIHVFAAAGTYRWQIDNLQIDDDTMPEACTE